MPKKIEGYFAVMHISNTILLIFAITLPACAYQKLSYKQDVAPILARNCNSCHMAPGGQGYREVGLKMDSYDSIINGTIYGSIIVVGDSRRSILNKMVEGRTGNNPCNSHGGHDGINQSEIEVLKLWVDQGAQNN